jgi:hypothetical protein
LSSVRSRAVRRRCTRLRTVGTLSRTAVAGENRWRFDGRPRRRPIAFGRYRALVSVVDASGNRSATRTARFTVVRP